MNSLNGLLKGARYCLPTVVTTPFCRIDCAENVPLKSFLLMAVLEMELLPLVRMWGKRLILYGAVLTSWAVKREAERAGKKTKPLVTVWRNLRSHKMPQLQIVPKSMDFPCLPVRWVRTLYRSKSEWVCDSGHNAAEQISVLPRLPCCQASGASCAALPARGCVSVKAGGGTICMKTPSMFANVQRWVILLEYFCFCPDFLWNSGFPVDKKFQLWSENLGRSSCFETLVQGIFNGACYR